LPCRWQPCSAAARSPRRRRPTPTRSSSKNCTSCHGSEVYTRPDRKIDSLSGLKTQVEACNTNLNTGMFPEEVNAVAELLNEEYYKFGE